MAAILSQRQCVNDKWKYITCTFSMINSAQRWNNWSYYPTISDGIFFSFSSCELFASHITTLCMFFYKFIPRLLLQWFCNNIWFLLLPSKLTHSEVHVSIYKRKYATKRCTKIFRIWVKVTIWNKYHPQIGMYCPQNLHWGCHFGDNILKCILVWTKMPVFWIKFDCNMFLCV